MGFPIRPIGPSIPLHHPMTVALLNTDITPPLSEMKSTKKSESCISLFCMRTHGLKINEKIVSIKTLIDFQLKFRYYLNLAKFSVKDSGCKSIIMPGAITDLENRHSMRLQGFLDLLGETGLDIFEGLVFIIIQGNGQYLLDVRNVQFYLHFFQIHFTIFSSNDVRFLQKDIQ